MLRKKTGLCDTSTLAALPGDDGVSTVAEPPLQFLPTCKCRLDSALPPRLLESARALRRPEHARPKAAAKHLIGFHGFYGGVWKVCGRVLEEGAVSRRQTCLRGEV